jgi:uncharacterized protein (DUF58 family)
MSLAAAAREQFIRWALRARPPEPEPIVLTQRRVYVLPTRAGLGYGVALIVMLIGAINYNLGLGYALTFLLGGLGVVAILHTFRNLVRLKVSHGRTPPVHAGDMATFHLLLAADGERHAIRLWLPDGAATTIDVPVGEPADAHLSVAAIGRGWLALPRIGLETRWPLGLIRAWAYAAPDARCLVYPRPAAKAPPLPWTSSRETGKHGGGGRGRDDFAGLREHQPADPPRHIAWKAAARRDEDAPLLIKQFEGASAASRLWLDWQALPDVDVEARLSILTCWALEAHGSGFEWGLRLPGVTLAPGSGQVHLDAALKALALHGQPS